MSTTCLPGMSPTDASLVRAHFSSVTSPTGMRTEKEENRKIQSLISALQLQPHVEGGYFAETDRDRRRVPNPFAGATMMTTTTTTTTCPPGDGNEADTRSASTSIFYLLTPTPTTSFGAFHRNRGRTVHTLHKGRARYVILHADEVATPAYPGGYAASAEGDGDVGDGEVARWSGTVRVEVFTVGQNVLAGERLQWIVEGGKYKASFLLPDDPDDSGKGSEEGCLISETVVPGFEFEDHDFLTRQRFDVLVSDEWKAELEWLLRKTG